MEVGLFPSLLGAAFRRLDSPVRNVHSGGSRRLSGTATVTRGRSLLARILCVAASLPRTANQVALEVHITTNERAEHWTRYFGDSRPMRSMLCARRGLLVERLGPVKLTFRLSDRDGGIDWSLVEISALGVKLPTSWFAVSAFSGARAERYTFAISTVRGVGPIIRYEGELDVISPH